MDHSHLRLFDPQGSEGHEHVAHEHVAHEPIALEPIALEPNADDRATRQPRSRELFTREPSPTVAFARVVGEARVAVSVGELLPVLAEAWESRRAWLGDFASDRVIVSQDLYEILLAYKRIKQSKAA
ncbi:MAG: hypothetical protein IT423_20345 [Pirellulaceae bacterium]|nr:hypothetical protein [Pirellulaceae bacterium]